MFSLVKYIFNVNVEINNNSVYGNPHLLFLIFDEILRFY
jgi:hypothetical protein